MLMVIPMAAIADMYILDLGAYGVSNQQESTILTKFVSLAVCLHNHQYTIYKYVHMYT